MLDFNPTRGYKFSLFYRAFCVFRLLFSDMFIRPVLRWWGRTFPLVLGDTEIFLPARACMLDWCPSGSCGR